MLAEAWEPHRCGKPSLDQPDSTSHSDSPNKIQPFAQLLKDFISVVTKIVPVILLRRFSDVEALSECVVVIGL